MIPQVEANPSLFLQTVSQTRDLNILKRLAFQLPTRGFCAWKRPQSTPGEVVWDVEDFAGVRCADLAASCHISCITYYLMISCMSVGEKSRVNSVGPSTHLHYAQKS